MKQEIKHQLFFPHPPAAVWEYLTNAELMDLWLMKSDFKPVLGHEFTFKAGPVPSLNFDGIIYCTVMEIVLFKKLSYTWKLGPGDGSINVDSIVEWELKPTEKGTELLLNHGFVVMESLGLFNAMNEGWLQHMHKMLDGLNN